MEKTHAQWHEEIAAHVDFHEARLTRLVALGDALKVAEKSVASAQAAINEIVAKSVKAKAIKSKDEIVQAEADLAETRAARATATTRLERLQRAAADAVAEAGAESFKDLLRLVAGFQLRDQGLLDEARAKSRALAKAADKQAAARQGDAKIASTLELESAHRLGFRGRVAERREVVETLHIEGHSEPAPAPTPVPNRQANGFGRSMTAKEVPATGASWLVEPRVAFASPRPPAPLKSDKGKGDGKKDKGKARRRGEQELRATKA